MGFAPLSSYCDYYYKFINSRHLFVPSFDDRLTQAGLHTSGWTVSVTWPGWLVYLDEVMLEGRSVGAAVTTQSTVCVGEWCFGGHVIIWHLVDMATGFSDWRWRRVSRHVVRRRHVVAMVTSTNCSTDTHIFPATDCFTDKHLLTYFKTFLTHKDSSVSVPERGRTT